MATWQPRQLGEHTWLLPVGTNVGLWAGDGGAVLVDSGNDKEAGRQLRKALEERGLALRLIVNTHSNADHIGGNAYLQSQTGCAVAATRLEAAFIADPLLEPSFLWGGFPFRALRGKFFEAKPSTVGTIIPGPEEGADSAPIPGTPLRAVALPGHFLQMIGVLTPDRVLFAGDGLFGGEVLARHPVFFLYDVAGHLETLARLERLEAEWVVPSHGEPVQGAAGRAALVAANRAALERILEAVREACGRPRAFEEVLAEVCGRFAVELDAGQYVLTGGTVRAALSWLADRGSVRPSFEGGRMLWGRVEG